MQAHRHHARYVVAVRAQAVEVPLELVARGVAVPGCLVAASREFRGDGGVALERNGGGEERDGDAGAVKDAKQAPDSGARAVLVHRLDRKVALIVELERQLV